MRPSIHDGCVTALLVTRAEKVSLPHHPEDEGGFTRASLIVVAREKSNDKMIEGARGGGRSCTRVRVLSRLYAKRKVKREKEESTGTGRGW